MKETNLDETKLGNSEPNKMNVLNDLESNDSGSYESDSDKYGYTSNEAITPAPTQESDSEDKVLPTQRLQHYPHADLIKANEAIWGNPKEPSETHVSFHTMMSTKTIPPPLVTHILLSPIPI